MIIGIDPGLGGAIALSPYEDQTLVQDMPTLEVAGKRVLDLHALAARLRQLKAYAERSSASLHAIVENVGARPGQGVSSMFKFGFVAGAIQATLATLEIPFTLVAPQTWKKHFKLGPDKDQARQLASRLLPLAAHQWARKKDDGRAEAALLALYGKEVLDR